MRDKVFIDTNLWIYLYSDVSKGAVVKSLVDKHYEDIIISTQVVGEFFHVVVSKKFKKKDEAAKIAAGLLDNFMTVPVNGTTVTKAISLNAKHDYSYWDSLIMAAALENNCTCLYSEDLQDGHVIDKKLKIVNPFAGGNQP